jgi:hypothetical protein
MGVGTCRSSNYYFSWAETREGINPGPVFPNERKLQKTRKNDMKFRHLLAVLALFAAVDSHAALIHQYELDGSLADTLGGSSLVANGGALGAVYTIDMMFHFDSFGLWRKIVDFSDLKNDSGLYTYGADLSFYGLGGTTGKLAALTDSRLTMTRSADAIFSIYQDGKLVAALNDRQYITDLASHDLNFFRDDRNGSEAGPGAVDFIHIYDKALSAAEVKRLAKPGEVAEPAAGLLMACGLCLLGLFSSQRQKGGAIGDQ